MIIIPSPIASPTIQCQPSLFTSFTNVLISASVLSSLRDMEAISIRRIRKVPSFSSNDG